MSGGALDDHNYIYYRIDEINEQDPQIREMLHDLVKYLHDEDYYLSGDTGEESWAEALRWFKAKWIHAVPTSDDEKTNSNRVVAGMLRTCANYLDGRGIF